MDRKELINKYIEFFKTKKHKEIQNASLIPENDPTVLFTTAGMHPIVPYLLGQPHSQGKRLVNVQKCIRTVDIDEVGDQVHHTFFEMLGNWSLGDYFKKEAIEFSFEFLTNILQIPLERIAITCFKGDKTSSQDKEAAETWIKLGIPESRIAFLPKSENWWETPSPGPCGPDTEMFYWSSSEKPPEKFDPENKNWVEIGNNVLMQYEKNKNGEYKPANQKNIDFGGGVERTVTILNGLEDNYISDLFLPLINKLEELSKKTYGEETNTTKAMRIIADHIKASCFIIADGITPSNMEQGYVLRRLIRRAIRYGRFLEIKNFTKQIAEPVFEIYKDYKHLKENKKKILEELEKEENKFLETLGRGMNIFNKLIKNKNKISGKDAFLLYQSYGFPIEITKELAKEKNIKVDDIAFEKENKAHQKLSKTATEGKFKSGLENSGEKTTRLHTTTHLLNEALNQVLKSEIQQKGSNITPERLRFDFNFDRKLTSEEKQEVENLINKKIKEKLSVTMKEMTIEQAKKIGAKGVFDSKYGDNVSVYSIGNFSKEICAGPHVQNTSELGNFKIKKEESSSAGVRRIKGFLE
jgi:alanyl-tRNA synthetase